MSKTSSFFRNLAALPADDGQMYVGQAGPKPGGDGWALNIARRLDLPDGSFAGVINVTYDMVDLIRYYGQSPLGRQGLLELVGERDERLLAAAGGGAAPGESIAGQRHVAGDRGVAGRPLDRPRPRPTASHACMPFTSCATCNLDLWSGDVGGDRVAPSAGIGSGRR